MELFALDKDFNIVNQLSSSNIQWNRKYYEHGDFAIRIKAENYSDNMAYVYTKERPELGIIQKVSYNESPTEKNIMLQGYFAERWLNDKIIYPTFYGIGEISNVITNMINAYKEDIPISGVTVSSKGDKVDFQETGMELGRKTNEVLQTQEMSYRMAYDFTENKFNIELYRGLDRTQSQTANNFITFSTLWGNIVNTNADKDNSNYKNYAVIAGEGESEERITVYVDLSNGGYKKKVFIDERQTRFNSSEQTLDQYHLKLQQKGLEKLLAFENVHNVAFTPNTNSYKYLLDYDLGDKCDIIINNINIIIEARIIEIHEVFKDNAHTITLEFGNKILKPIEKVERRIQ